MPTVSEPLWPTQDEKTQAIIEDYLQGIDSVDVFRARLYGNGLRGHDLGQTIRHAVQVKDNRKPALPSSKVLVMRRDNSNATLRFTNSFYAGRAVELLRRQPNVLFACRVEN